MELKERKERKEVLINDTVNERILSFIEKPLSEVFRLGLYSPEEFNNIRKNEVVTIFSDGSIDDSKGHNIKPRLTDPEIVRFLDQYYDLFL